MTKTEFLAELRAHLVGRIPAEELEEHISYYENYINSYVRMGTPEESVVSELNSPVLLAKSILAANSAKIYENGEFAEMGEGAEDYSPVKKVLSFSNWPAWAKVTGICILAVLILAILVKMVIFALPILLPVGLVIFLYNYFEKKKR